MEADGAVMMKKRGELSIMKSLVVFLIFIFMVVLSSEMAIAGNCCVAAEMGDNVCEDITFTECCGDGSWDYWSLCNETFIEGQTCEENGTEHCNERSACMYNITYATDSHVACSNFYEIECLILHNGTFYEGELSNSLPQCADGCCIYFDEEPFCVSMRYEECQTRGGIFNNVECGEPCTEIFTPEYGNITGYIHNQSTARRLDGALVEADGVSFTTGADGYYELANVSRGYLTITASMDGYTTKYDSVVVYADSITEKNITLNPSTTGRIWGIVTKTAGSFISEAWVVLNGIGLTNTNNFGLYEFIVAPGSYTLTAGKSGYSTETSGIIIVDTGDNIEEYFSLEPTSPSNITGRVTNNSLGVSESIIVKLEGIDTDFPTDPSGSYKIEGLGAGTYIVYVEKVGYWSNSTTVTLNSNEEKTVDINIHELETTTCDDLGGDCCGENYVCYGSQDTTSDCSICCLQACTDVPPVDTDGDGVYDMDEPNCMWEYALNDISPERLTNESWADGTCDDGIDNDCDSNGFFTLDPMVGNKEDGFDSDCGFCEKECDFDNNIYCNVTRALELVAEGKIPADYPEEIYIDFGVADDTYCGLCSGDSECLNSCTENNYYCCNQCSGNIMGYECNAPNICCETGCSSSVTYGCCNYEWECPANRIVSEGTCESPLTTCLDECYMPSCKPGLNINDTLNFNVSIGNKMCACGSLYNTWNGSIEDTDSDSGLCCWDGQELTHYETGPCPSYEVGHLIGYVKNDESEGIGNARINIPSKGETAYTDNTGHYIIDNIELGNWNIKASALLYVSNMTTVPITKNISEGYNIFNFVLKSEEGCNIEASPVESFIVWNVMGKSSLTMNWVNPCPSHIKNFFINRTPDKYGFSKAGGSENYEILDEGLEWNTDYTYTIWAEYETIPSIPGIRLSSPINVTINTGNPLCENRSIGMGFCVNSSYLLGGNLIYGISCNYMNQLELESDCTNPTFCWSEEGNDCVCVADISGNTKCKQLMECKDETGGEPFGLYYTEESCLIGTTENYCYYDYTDTIVDSCHNCSPEMSCFDYSSKDACTTDNCGACENDEPMEQNCGWLDTGYDEFGMGICYKPEYDDIDYCGMCNKSSNSPFQNPNCTIEVCSRLGACYSKDEGDYCAKCLNATCENYDDEISCIGMDKYNFILTRNFSIPYFAESINESYDYFDYSLDACGLERCKWGIPDGIGETELRCFKDGDDDEEADCPKEEGSAYGKMCRQDNEAPETRIINFPSNYINSKGYNFTLEVDGLGKWGYEFDERIEIKYCIDKSNTCIPNHDIPRENMAVVPGSGSDWQINLTVPNRNYTADWFDTESVYLRFYSKDYYYNTETIKGVELAVDMAKPIVTISYVVVNGSNPKESDLFVKVTSSDIADCSVDSLSNIGTGDVIAEGIPDSGFGTYFEGNYYGLLDGRYRYSVTCTDVHDNSQTEEEYINIDRLKLIYDEFPDTNLSEGDADEERLNNIFTDSSIPFSLKTPKGAGDNINCNFYDNYNNVDVPLFQRTEGNDGGNYYWQHNLSLPWNVNDDGTFYFDVVCENLTEEIDRTSFLFTIDRIAPETLLYYSLDGYTYLFLDRAYRPETEFIFECYDENLSAPSNMPVPGEARCKETLWCNSTTSCTLSTPIESSGSLKFDSSTKLYYYSRDYKDNTESTKSVAIIIDGNDPTIAITSPPNNFVTNIKEGHAISGTWSDESEIEEIYAIMNDERVNLTFNMGGAFSGTLLNLTEGLNEIVVWAVDIAGNIGSNTTNIYYDIIGPGFTKATILNSSLDEVDNETTGFVEWGHEFVLYAEVNDDYTNLGIQNNSITAKIDDLEYELNTVDYVNFNKTIPFPAGKSAGLWKVTFNASDKFNNTNTVERFFRVMDTIAPEFEIQILDNEQPTDVVIRNRNYTINVVSSEELSSVPVLVFTPNETRMGEVNVVLSRVDGSWTDFNGTTSVPYWPGFDYLRGDKNNTIWLINGVDSRGVEGHKIKPEYFIIDTQGPVEQDIENLGMIEYTNTDVFAAGIARTGSYAAVSSLNISIMLNDITNNIDSQGWKEAGSVLSAVDAGLMYEDINITSAVNKGQSHIILNGSYGFQDKYMLFSDEMGMDVSRENLMFYSIDSFTMLSGPKTNLTIIPALEHDITTSYKAHIYDNPVPTAWFGINLAELTEGNNYAYAVGFDEHGIMGDISPNNVHNIIYDETPPYHVDKSEMPRAERYINNNRTAISVRISDENSGASNISMIIRNTMNATFDENVVGTSDTPFVCLPTDGLSSEYLITLNWQDIIGTDEMPDGDHNVTIMAMDQAGNTGTYTWKFKIDPSMSDYPKYHVNGSFEKGYFDSYEREIRYTNFTSVDVTANFTGNVSLKSFGLSAGGSSIVIENNTLVNFTKYRFLAEGLSEDEYLFEIEARRIVGGAETGNILPDSLIILIDTTAPVINNLMVLNTSGGTNIEKGKNFTISAEITEKSPNATIEYEIKNNDGLTVLNGVISVEDIHKNNPYSLSIEIESNKTAKPWLPGYGSHTLILTATDGFGKSSDSSVSFFVNDTAGPEIILIKPEPFSEGSFTAYTPEQEDILIKVETNEEANCTIKKQGGGLHNFSLSNNFTHEFTYTWYLDEDLHVFNITCSDSFDHQTTETLHLYVDLHDPFIGSADIEPAIVYQRDEELATLSATADEDVKCKYILEDNLTAYNMNSWGIMDLSIKRDIFDLGKWFDSSDDYGISHIHELRDTELRNETDGDYIYYIICEDISGRLSRNYRTVKLEVNFNWTLRIDNQGPNGIIYNPNPLLFVETNLISECSVGSVEPIALVAVPLGENPMGPHRHTIPLPLTLAGEDPYVHDTTYDYYVNCKIEEYSKEASTTVTFTTDYELEAPIINIISPVPDSTVTAPQIFIAGTIIAHEEITSANLTLNNYDFRNICTGNSGTLEFNETVELVEGLNNFTIMAITPLSTQEADETYHVILDTTGPEGDIEID